MAFLVFPNWYTCLNLSFLFFCKYVMRKLIPRNRTCVLKLCLQDQLCDSSIDHHAFSMSNILQGDLWKIIVQYSNLTVRYCDERHTAAKCSRVLSVTDTMSVGYGLRVTASSYSTTICQCVMLWTNLDLYNLKWYW